MDCDPAMERDATPVGDLVTVESPDIDLRGVDDTDAVVVADFEGISEADVHAEIVLVLEVVDDCDRVLVFSPLPDEARLAELLAEVLGVFVVVDVVVPDTDLEGDRVENGVADADITPDAVVVAVAVADAVLIPLVVALDVAVIVFTAEAVADDVPVFVAVPVADVVAVADDVLTALAVELAVAVLVLTALAVPVADAVPVFVPVADSDIVTLVFAEPVAYAFDGVTDMVTRAGVGVCVESKPVAVVTPDFENEPVDDADEL